MAHLTNWACKYMLRKIIVVVHCLESEILHKVRAQPLGLSPNGANLLV